MRRLGVDRAGTSLTELKKEKDLLNSLKTEVVEYAGRDGKKSLTQNDIDLFLMEKEIVLPRRLKRMIHGLVNQELE